MSPTSMQLNMWNKTKTKPLGETVRKIANSRAVTEPTEWVSEMAVVHKPNGKLRICIDPQPLTLKRKHYRLPVLDNVLPKLKDAKVFSKLEVQEMDLTEHPAK